jgi:hypothetical protein
MIPLFESSRRADERPAIPLRRIPSLIKNKLVNLKVETRSLSVKRARTCPLLKAISDNGDNSRKTVQELHFYILYILSKHTHWLKVSKNGAKNQF